MNYLLLAQEAGADAAGFFSFINIMWVFVGIVFLVAFIGLFGKYILPLIAELPVQVIEAGAYATGASLSFVTPHYWGPTASFIAAIIGLPILIIAIACRIAENWRLSLAVAVFLTGCAAHQHQSQFFGGVSVLFLLGLFGSWVVPFLDQFDSEPQGNVVPGGFWASAVILAVTGYLSFTSNPQWFLVFKPGAFWLAGLVYTGGLMTLSSRYYYKGEVTGAWLFWQVAALISGVGAMYLGHTYASYMGTTVLQEIGGTFLAMFLVSKISEIPWNLDYWPWLALGAALAGYGALTFASQHPDYFLAF